MLAAIWPAFWTVGGDWPSVRLFTLGLVRHAYVGPKNGEIDILEGVHDNEHNQVAWHTNPGMLSNGRAIFEVEFIFVVLSFRLHIRSQCKLYRNHSCAFYLLLTLTKHLNLGQQTNGINNTDCDANVNSNAGCDVTDWSRASYGPFFEAQGGGILVMKWDENDISVCKYIFCSLFCPNNTACLPGSFYRAAIPSDITQKAPNPSLWGPPSAILPSTQCDIGTFFTNHNIVFGMSFLIVSGQML